jgi:hypothetical protein
VVFAAPSYFARHGRPRRPEELAHHQCIVRTAARDANAWPFRIDGRTKAVKVAGLFRTNRWTEGRRLSLMKRCDQVVDKGSGRCLCGSAAGINGVKLDRSRVPFR